jgi:hypothetical protein
MGSEHGQTGIPVPFRPLFIELTEQQLDFVDEAQAEADEEALVTAMVERLRCAGRRHYLERQIRLVRAWHAKGEAEGQVSPRLRGWLRALERDEELNGWGSAWTRDVDCVDLWPTMLHHRSDAGKAPWDLLSRYDGPLNPAYRHAQAGGAAVAQTGR